MSELRVDDLSMAFGSHRVLEAVSFTLSEPQICGLIGPNGAGKSTLVNCLTGVHQPTSGRILLDGESLSGLPPFEIARRRMGRTFQVPRPFRRMSVLENLLVPGLARPARWPRALAMAMEALDLLGLARLAHEQARALSGGQLKLLELARLLMLEPAILILDEPFAGVHPALRERIGAFITAQRRAGRSFVIIEHDIRAVFALSERLLVLAAGRLIADGDPKLLERDQAVIAAYLGRREAGEEPAGGA